MNSEEVREEKAKEKEIHNNEIYSQISELETEKQKYIDVRAAADAIKGSNEALTTDASNTNKLLQQIKVNGEPIGKNAFEAKIAKQISSCKKTFISISSECGVKIEEIEGKISSLRAQLW